MYTKRLKKFPLPPKVLSCHFVVRTTLHSNLGSTDVTAGQNRHFMFLFLFLFFLAVLGLRCCAQAFSSCGEWGLLFVAVHGFLTAVASPVAEHRL